MAVFDAIGSFDAGKIVGIISVFLVLFIIAWVMRRNSIRRAEYGTLAERRLEQEDFYKPKALGLPQLT